MPDLLPVPQWVSAGQIPGVFGISARTVQDAERDGAPIEVRYIGRKPVYRVESINRWIAGHSEDKESRESA
jgi:phage terminase Nu1 subunit (DNA packaging protein)